MDATHSLRHRPGYRILGIAFGIGTQAFFLVTVWYLFWFLKDGGSNRHRGALWIDLLLAMQFTAPHSVLLIPPVRKSLGKWVIREFYPLFYCFVTCVHLLVTIGFWRTSHTVIWELTGVLGTCLQVGFYGSWIALMYSLNLSGFGTQTGLPQWWCWVCHRPLPRPEFKPRGAYLWLRHPVYLSFAGLIWFTPKMTLDHAILTAVWTIYIFVGGYVKDLRMTFYLGDAYRDYQRTVPGFPLMPFGPLARRNVASGTATPPSARSNASAHRDAA